MANRNRNSKSQDLQQKPNIAFVGDNGAAVTTINNGMETIILPPVEKQSSPFFHNRAATIIQLFPKLYKPVRDK